MFTRTLPTFSLIRRAAPTSRHQQQNFFFSSMMNSNNSNNNNDNNFSSSSSLTWCAPTYSSSFRFHGEEGDKSKPVQVRIEFGDGVENTYTAYEGQSLIDIAHFNDLPIEAACAGSVACSTCHCYLENEEAMELFDEPTDEEYDMLDQAYMPGPTSRLGCQLKVKKGKHDNIKFRLPKATRNMAVDGYVAKGH